MKKGKIKIVLLVTLLALTTFKLISDRFITAENLVDDYISFQSPQLDVKKGNEWITYTNDMKVNVGDSVRFHIKWNVLAQNMEHLEIGSKFSIDLPKELLAFPDSNWINLIDTYTGNKYGEWAIKNNQIVVIFSEGVGNITSLENGNFTVEGTVVKSGSTQIKIKDSEELSLTTSPKEDDVDENPIEGNITKRGQQLQNQHTILWTSYVNFNDYKKLYINENIETKHKVVFEDKLSEQHDIDIKDVRISIPIYEATSAQTMSNEIVVSIPLSDTNTGYFEKQIEDENETYEQFFERIRNSEKPTIGVYQNKNLVISFNDLPSLNNNGIYLDDSWYDGSRIEYMKLDGYFKSSTTEHVLKRIFDKENGKSSGQVIAFQISFKTSVHDDVKDLDMIENRAKLYYGSEIEESIPSEVQFNSYYGSLDGRFGNVILTKYDKDTNEVLSGVTFGLYNELDEPLNENLLTDEFGNIKVDNLVNGKYYFKELVAKEGYVREDSKFYFTINSSNVNSTIAVYNSKIMINEVGNVILHKLDSKSSGPLESAVFNLYDENGQLVKENLVSNSSGNIEANELDLGKYYFVEKIAPKEYQLDSSKIYFEISKDKEIVSIKFPNAKIEKEEEPRGEDPKEKENEAPTKPTDKNINLPSKDVNTFDSSNRNEYIALMLVAIIVGVRQVRKREG